MIQGIESVTGEKFEKPTERDFRQCILESQIKQCKENIDFYIAVKKN